MAEEAIMQQVDIMDETASQTVTTKEDKQQLIEQLQGQLKSLKAMLPKKEIDTLDKSADDVNNEVTSCKTGVKTKKPEEDTLDIWEMCACESADCPTCEADKQATIAATVWIDSQTFTQTESHSYREERVADEKTELEDQKERDCYERSTGMNFHDEMQQVSILVPLGYTYAVNCSPLIRILLNPSLCARESHKFRGNSFACGVITLQFAHKVIKAKPQWAYQWLDPGWYLSDEFYEIVTSSLQDGNDIYMANYKGRSECLSSEEIILINSHLDIQLIEEVTLDTVMIDTLAVDIMSLKIGQILLLIRMKDYNIWSVVRFKKEFILIFDCQSHNNVTVDGKKSVCGGIIYLVARRPYTVIRILQIAEEYSGRFMGQCRIATIQT